MEQMQPPALGQEPRLAGRALQGDGVGSWGEQIEATVYRMDEKTKVLLYSTGNYI